MFGFLNSTFNETPTSLRREQKPTLLIHPEDAASLGIENDSKIIVANERGEVQIHCALFDGVQRGVVIAESIWPNHAYPDGQGINTLTGSDTVAPVGGAALHDNRVSIRPASGT